MPSNVILQSRAYHTDGETRLLDPNNPVSEEQMGMLQKDQSFEMRIMLNGSLDRNSDEWAETIGHEVFVHSSDDAKFIKDVMDALKNGVSLEDVLDLMKDLDKASTSVYRDHGRLEAGKDEDYNQYIKELENEKE